MTDIDRLELIANNIADLESYCLGSAFDRILEYSESQDVDDLEQAATFLKEAIAYKLYKDNQGVEE